MSKKIIDLTDLSNNLISTQEMVATKNSISIQEAASLITTMTFRDYLALHEAVTTGTVGTTGTNPKQSPAQAPAQGQAPNQPDPNEKVPQPPSGKGGKPPFDLNSVKVGGYVGYKGPGNRVDNYKVKKVFRDGVEVDVNGKSIRLHASDLTQPTNKDKSTGYDRSKGAVDRRTPTQRFVSMKNTMMNPIDKFMKGYRSTVKDSCDHGDDELNRLMELAGLKEIGSMGGTGSANVASAVSAPSMPSVVGNTNDAHKPSVKIRAKLRKQRDKEQYRKDHE